MLDIRLLGVPDIRTDGESVVVDTRKAIALLAYLVVEKKASRDSLAALFWADSSNERARATLRRTLSALRGITNEPLIGADRNTVTLVGHVTTDLDALSSEIAATKGHGHDAHEVCMVCIPHLRRATALYRGDFLEGFSIKASPRFDDWVRTVAESARLAIGGAFMRLGAALAAEGDYPAAIAAVTQWLDLDTLHEPAHRSLMLLHAWAGDRAGAINTYRNCLAILELELGVPPLEETTELFEAILDEDLPPAPATRRKVEVAARPTARLGEPALIGREPEMNWLRERALGGAGRVVVIRGAPWMGKTRLLEQVAVEADADRTVLVARAFRLEQTLPYGVATQILRAALAARPEDEVPSWATAELGRLLPELGVAPTSGPSDRFGELRFLEAAHTVLSSIGSARPVLILLDDTQWMDTPSAEVLSYLARRMVEESMSIVATVRTGDPLPAPIMDMIGAADTDIMLRPLTAEEIRPHAVDQSAAEEIQRNTGGVPLLVLETLESASAVEERPEMVRYLEARLLEVGELGRQVLTAASVLDGVCDAGVLRETSGRTEDEVIGAVEELLAAGLLREVPESDGLGFTLDALARMTYESTSAVRRRLLHRRAAKAMSEKRGAAFDVGLAAAVAAQYDAAGDPEAAEWYRIAGDLARSVYANDPARGFYDQSLALGNPAAAPIRLALGELALTSGDYNQARYQLTLALGAGGGLDGVVEHRLGDVERHLGRFQLAAEHYARALGSHPAPVAVLSDWALLAYRTGDPGEAMRLASRAMATAIENGDTALLSRVHSILAVVATDTDVAMGHAAEAIALAGHDEVLRMAALNNKARLLARSGRSDDAVHLVTEATEIAVRTGHRHREAALWNHLADLHHQAGREKQSREALTRAVSLFADVDSGDLEPEVWLLSMW
jgi:DNA-binding SARP family transcriptional activator